MSDESDDDGLLDALEALARLEGKEPKELLGDLLRQRLGGEGGGSSRRSTALARDPQRDPRYDPSITPVRPNPRDRYEQPQVAQQRYYRAEQEDPAGVLGLGGATAGGIFGEGPIVTERYDPAAERRTESRLGGAVQVQILQLLERMGDRLDVSERQLAAALDERKALPRSRGRR